MEAWNVNGCYCENIYELIFWAIYCRVMFVAALEPQNSTDRTGIFSFFALWQVSWLTVAAPDARFLSSLSSMCDGKEWHVARWRCHGILEQYGQCWELWQCDQHELWLCEFSWNFIFLAHWHFCVSVHCATHLIKNLVCWRLSAWTQTFDILHSD